MKTVEAKILDPCHLELSEPLPEFPGDLIRIAIPDGEGEMEIWRRAALERLLGSYDPGDSIYDQLL